LVRRDNEAQVQMTVELEKVEARQADRRHMSLRVLVWALPAAIVLLGLIYLVWL
jgi:hypothetical protein